MAFWASAETPRELAEVEGFLPCGHELGQYLRHGGRGGHFKEAVVRSHAHGENQRNAFNAECEGGFIGEAAFRSDRSWQRFGFFEYQDIL